jgi:exopolyphosphatase/guanosine-5'-triphosphate,3'-diphosphate pyrophosphatase
MARRGVIDVGTNSVKVLVADVTDGSVIPVWETGLQTRLGRGFYESHRLQPEPIAATAHAVARFATQARELGVTQIRVVATSAVRDAVNGAELVAAILHASSLTTEVIPGDTEALWGFLGVTTDPELSGRRLLIVDVGGGSTELILGRAGHVAYRQSFPLGSVRLHQRFPSSDPPAPDELVRVRTWLQEFLQTEIEAGLSSSMAGFGRPERVLGVGGTTAILALMQAGTDAFDRGLVEQARFPMPILTGIVEALWSESLEERRRRRGLPPERADVIPFGAVIYEVLMQRFDLGELGVSTRGLRFGALLEDAGGS